MSDHDAHTHGHDAHDDHAHDWFRHEVNEVAQQDHGSFNARMVFAVLVFTALVVVLSVVIMAPQTKRMLDNLAVQRQERNDAGYLKARSAQATWDAALKGEPVWINREQGLLQIPYDLAAEQVVKRYANR
jgi:hypothetical protein